jgi:hypothetical protein
VVATVDTHLSRFGRVTEEPVRSIYIDENGGRHCGMHFALWRENMTHTCIYAITGMFDSFQDAHY